MEQEWNRNKATNKSKKLDPQGQYPPMYSSSQLEYPSHSKLKSCKLGHLEGNVAVMATTSEEYSCLILYVPQAL